MKWIWRVVFLALVTTRGEAQVFHSPVRSAYLTGGAYSAHFTDGFSFTGNPAVLGSVKHFCLAVSSERRWMLKELAFHQMACSFSAGNGGIGLQFHYTGNYGYNETAIALSYGKDLGSILLGLQFRYDTDHTAGYGNETNGSAMLGMRFHPLDRVYAGFAFSASLLGAGRNNSEKAAGDYNMGFGYEASSFVFLSVQLEKEAGLPLNITGCVDYKWSDQFYASMGIAGLSASPFIKAGWKKNQLTIEIFTAYETELGFTPGLVLLWEGKNK